MGERCACGAEGRNPCTCEPDLVLCRYKVTAAEGSGLTAVGPDWQEPDHFLLDKADPAWVGDPEMGRGWRQWEIVDLTTGERTGVIVGDLVGEAPADVREQVTG